MATAVRISAFDELPDGRGLPVQIGEHRIAVFRIGEDVYALGDRCSHAEASLAEGEVYDLEVECPRHGSAFDLETGEPLTLPAIKPVAVYSAAVVDGDVVLSIEDDEVSG